MTRPPVELVIESLGDAGDGIARTADGPVYLPYALAGERVLAEIEAGRGKGRAARVVEIVEPASNRIAPPCPHFGDCGGCALQHLDQPPYLAWKRQRVLVALARQGLDSIAVGPTVATPAASRRRVRLAARRLRQGVVVGFNARRSRRIVDLDTCPVLRPAILALLPALRRLLETLLEVGSAVDVGVTETTGGLDLWIVAKGEPDLAARETLAAFAVEEDLARLHWGADIPECIVARRRAAMAFGPASVEAPVTAFLQASAEGEAALRDAVLAASAGAEQVCDLFAGCGTLSLPLALGARVHAVDQDADALAALAAAYRATANLRAVTVERRDLFRRPLTAAELDRFDAVVFDPPRAGARAQAAALAASAVALVVAVSCHPGSFARDARILVDGGYRLVEVTPIDQFLWSPHVELVATFTRSSASAANG
jgi:23S rRNA (uracil1939-C5)-methyltransferase